MSRSGALSLALIVVAVNSCSDRGGVNQLTGLGDSPSLLISDAAHSSGVEGFYFLPPLVASQSFAGTFDPGLSPEVKVCELMPATPPSSGFVCGAVIKTFNGGTGAERVTADGVGQSYNALWKTKKNPSGLLLGRDKYRLEVYVGSGRLGYADLWIVANNKSLNVVTDEYIGIARDGTLNIKFRIETTTVGEVTVSPATPSIGPGSQVFTATVKDLHDNTVSGLTVNWTSSNVGVATVNPASSTTNGSGAATTTATAVGDGTTTMTAEAGGVQGTATLTVVLDQPPVAVNDAATLAEDATVTTINVLANDTDTDGGPKSITSVTQAANGSVAITNAGANLTYTPNASYCNSPPGTTLDTFTYTVSPGGSTATVSVTVTCLDDPPVAVADAATVLENSGATAIDVLANDTDVDGGPTLVTSVTQPANGTVVITGSGIGLTYQPNANYCNNPPGSALETFTYTLTPGGSMTTVTVTVTCVNDLPVAVDDAATVSEDATATTINVLANDSDAGGATVASVTQPTNGTVAITNAGANLTYTPNANYCNSPPGTTLDTFTYTVSPGGSTATVSVTVTCLDDNPVAVADAATVLENSGATAIDVLANDTDVDGGPKSITSVTQAANGTVVITGGGTGLTYQPNPTYCNSLPGMSLETFTYTLTPGGSIATVTITVTCVGNPIP